MGIPEFPRDLGMLRICCPIVVFNEGFAEAAIELVQCVAHYTVSPVIVMVPHVTEDLRARLFIFPCCTGKVSPRLKYSLSSTC